MFGPVGAVLLDAGGDQLERAEFTGCVVQGGGRVPAVGAAFGEAWSPRELRHSFVSIMIDSGAPIENIADLCGHSSTAVTEEVYRHQLKPVITKGAEAMNAVFGVSESA